MRQPTLTLGVLCKIPMNNARSIIEEEAIFADGRCSWRTADGSRFLAEAQREDIVVAFG